MKNETKIPKLVCSVWREDSREYGHVTLAYYTGASLDRYSPQPFLMLKWQCDRENVGWYGFRAEMTRDNPDAMLHAMKLAAPLLAKIVALPSCAPGAILAELQFPRWVNDDRMSKWIPVEEVAGPEYRRWMSWTDGSCCVSAVATDEEDAKLQIMRKYAGNISECRYGGYAAKLEAWIAAGKPVRMDDYAKCPDTTPTDELLKPFKSKQADEPIVPALPQGEAVAA